MGKSMSSLLAAIIVLCFLSLVMSDASDHRFKRGDSVPFYVNKDLTFCSPVEVEEKKETLGEVLSEDRLVAAPYKINFLIDREHEIICAKRLKREAVAKFRTAVLKDYFFQMYLDDLPIWGSVGRYDSEAKDDQTGPTVFLFKHLKSQILYNEDRIIDIVVQNDPNTLVDMTEDKEIVIDFLYSVIWIETDTPFEKRLEKYSQTSLRQHHLEIHSFSIIGLCFYLIFSTGIHITILMRILKNNFVKSTDNGEQDYSGWKNVFRYPRYKSLFAAALGTGTQLFVLAIIVFMYALFGKGALFSALITVYVVTSGIAGYSAVSFYYMIEGKNRVKTLILTGILFSGPLFLTFCFLNTVALAYNSTAARPFGTINVIVLIWTLVIAPLLVFGGIAGMNSRSEFQASRRTSMHPSEIPWLPWYYRPLAQMALAGCVPFTAIYAELDYIFASVWGHQIDTGYSILFIVFIILLIATAFNTAALTYLQLAVEDHEWWWRSFLNGGSVSFFIYGYSFYCYHARSNMAGFVQTSVFFGYTACICYGLFLMLGAVGFSASLIFVRHINRSMKSE